MYTILVYKSYLFGLNFHRLIVLLFYFYSHQVAYTFQKRNCFDYTLSL